MGVPIELVEKMYRDLIEGRAKNPPGTIHPNSVVGELLSKIKEKCVTDQEKIFIAREHLYALCESKKRFTMSIPAREDDTDVIFADALRCADELLKKNAALEKDLALARVEVARLLGHLEKWKRECPDCGGDGILGVHRELDDGDISDDFRIEDCDACNVARTALAETASDAVVKMWGHSTPEEGLRSAVIHEHLVDYYIENCGGGTKTRVLCVPVKE